MGRGRPVLAWVVLVAGGLAGGAGVAGGAPPTGSVARFSASVSIEQLFSPPTRRDSRDVAAGPLDVRSVSFGQEDTELRLRIGTRGGWATRDLARTGRSLCLELRHGAGALPVGRLCVGGRGRRTVLRYAPLRAGGRPGRSRAVAADVSRADDRSLLASFPAREVDLPLGAFSWSLEARWQDAAGCRAGCTDLVPDGGSYRARVSVLAQPPCFGAAARAPGRPCRNPLLRYAVVPTPFDAAIWLDGPCTPSGRAPGSVLNPCAFGVLDGHERGIAAVIGDSHARQWRGALDVVAQARRWKILSITRPGCPFSTELFASPSLGPATCARLHQETLNWLRAHRRVHTIFVSDWTGLHMSAAGFSAIWGMVPASVRRIYVLRDIPGTRASTGSCVQAVRRRHGATAGVCALSRSAAAPPDPEAVAAAHAPSRVRLIDMTRYFCGLSLCYPVLGGAYVYKDDNHMNGVFSTSLGPFLLRRLR